MRIIFILPGAWYWEYGGGLMADWGLHMFDIAILAMQVDAPLTVSAGGASTPFLMMHEIPQIQ